MNDDVALTVFLIEEFITSSIPTGEVLSHAMADKSNLKEMK
ncbi:MAG: hypothetical protein ACLR9J_07190 [Eubacterium sp.]